MPLYAMGVVLALSHTDWFVNMFNVGEGFTNILKLLGVVGHPFAVADTVIVALSMSEPTLDARNDGIATEPADPKPTPVLLLVQL